MGNRFHICRALDSSLCSFVPIPHRLLRETCLCRVMRDTFWLCLSNLWKLCLQYLGNTVVVLLPRALEQRLIRRVLDEGMLKDIRCLWWYPSVVDNLCLDQPAQLTLQGKGIQLRNCLKQF